MTLCGGGYINLIFINWRLIMKKTLKGAVAVAAMLMVTAIATAAPKKAANEPKPAANATVKVEAQTSDASATEAEVVPEQAAEASGEEAAKSDAAKDSAATN